LFLFCWFKTTLQLQQLWAIVWYCTWKLKLKQRNTAYGWVLKASMKDKLLFVL
jgi:hypothetical protein